MSKDKKYVLSKRKYSMSIILTEDETIRDTVVDRFIENANALGCKTKGELTELLFKDIQSSDINKYQTLSRITSGWNAHLKYLIAASSVFKINMYHFMDMNDSEYSNHPYEEYDEFEIAMRNIRNALVYGEYTLSFLTQIKRVSGGEYDTPIGAEYDKEFRTEYFSSKRFMSNFAINNLIYLEKLLNIPIHAFFIPNENVFRTYMENSIPQSYYREKYLHSNIEEPSVIAHSRRREKALAVEPDHDKLGNIMRSLPIYDEALRNTIIRNINTLMVMHGVTRANIARALGVSKFIATSLIEGRNTHVDHYFKLCDYFGVFFGDLIDPDITTLEKFDCKNADIDLRAILLNECSRIHLDINSLDKNKLGDEKFYKMKNSLWHLYQAVNRSTKNSTNDRNHGIRNRTPSKYRTLFNTLLDYCELFHTDLVSLIRDNVTVTREKAPNRINTINKLKVITTKDPDMIFIYDTYKSLTQDQKGTVMQLLKILREKNSGEKSQTTE